MSIVGRWKLNRDKHGLSIIGPNLTPTAMNYSNVGYFNANRGSLLNYTGSSIIPSGSNGAYTYMVLGRALESSTTLAKFFLFFHDSNTGGENGLAWMTSSGITNRIRVLHGRRGFSEGWTSSLESKNIGQWYVMAVTFNGTSTGNFLLYVNGIYQNYNTIAGVGTGSTPCCSLAGMGGVGGPNQWLTCEIAEAVIWNEVLPVGEIRNWGNILLSNNSSYLNIPFGISNAIIFPSTTIGFNF